MTAPKMVRSNMSITSNDLFARNHIISHFKKHGFNVRLSKPKGRRSFVKFRTSEDVLAFKLAYASIADFTTQTGLDIYRTDRVYSAGFGSSF